MYITFASTKQATKAEPAMALKPRGEITKNPKQGYQWPQNRTHVCPPKTFAAALRNMHMRFGSMLGLVLEVRSCD